MGKAGQRGGHKRVVLKSAGWFTRGHKGHQSGEADCETAPPLPARGWGLAGVTPLSRGVVLGPPPESCTAETGLPRRTAGPPGSNREMGAEDRPEGTRIPTWSQRAPTPSSGKMDNGDDQHTLGTSSARHCMAETCAVSIPTGDRIASACPVSSPLVV